MCSANPHLLLILLVQVQSTCSAALEQPIISRHRRTPDPSMLNLLPPILPDCVFRESNVSQVPSKGSVENDALIALFVCQMRLSRYTCYGRCDQNERVNIEFENGPLCYCDQQCAQLRDCCHDYSTECRSSLSAAFSQKETKKETCVVTGETYKYTGHIVVQSCPANGTNQYLNELCLNEGGTTHDKDVHLIGRLPVMDINTNTTYGNIFCASCNHAQNLQYWTSSARCPTANLSSYGELLAFVKRNCSMSYSPPKNHSHLARICTPQLQSCKPNAVNDGSMWSKCEEYCASYSFPVYRKVDGLCKWFKNPHCAMCYGIPLSQISCERCQGGHGGTSVPYLSILFDFRSTGRQITTAGNKQNKVMTKLESTNCDTGHVYDPFSGECRNIIKAKENYIHSNNTTLNTTGLYHSINTTEIQRNCSYVQYNTTDVTVFSNGSLLLHSQGILFSNSSYILTVDYAFVCLNFTSHYKQVVKYILRSKPRTVIPVALGIITCVGCSISLVALLLFLLNFALFPELFNLPGKILANLALALLVFHVLFFMVGVKFPRGLCLAIGVGIHYFLLVGFLWMGVMAFDVHRTFTNQENAINKSSYSLFVKYFLLAWLLPGVVVGTSAAIDLTIAGTLAYGGGDFCFISGSSGLLFSFIIPVCVILLGNIIALARTMLHIGRVRKTTRHMTNHRHDNHLSIICLKMTSFMGITWLLGIIAASNKTMFVWYPFTILNSLQGFFILLSFMTSQRVITLYKNKLGRTTDTSTDSTKAPSQNHTLDTHL